MPIQGIEFTDLTLSAQAGFECLYAKGVKVNNTKILPGARAASVFSITDSTDVTIEKAFCPPGAEAFLRLSGAKTSGIRLVSTDVSPARKDVVLEDGAAVTALSVR